MKTSPHEVSAEEEKKQKLLEEHRRWSSKSDWGWSEGLLRNGSMALKVYLEQGFSKKVPCCRGLACTEEC